MQRQIGQLVVNPWTRFQFALQGAGALGAVRQQAASNQGLTVVIFNQVSQTTNVLLAKIGVSVSAPLLTFVNLITADPGYANRWTAFYNGSWPDPTNLNTEFQLGAPTPFGNVAVAYDLPAGGPYELLRGSPLLIRPGSGVAICTAAGAALISINPYFYQTPL